MQFIKELFTTTPVNWVAYDDRQIIISFLKKRFHADKEFADTFWLCLDLFLEGNFDNSGYKDVKVEAKWENFASVRELTLIPELEPQEINRLGHNLKILAEEQHKPKQIEDADATFLIIDDQTDAQDTFEPSAASIEASEGSELTEEVKKATKRRKNN